MIHIICLFVQNFLHLKFLILFYILRQPNLSQLIRKRAYMSRAQNIQATRGWTHTRFVRAGGPDREIRNFWRRTR